MQRLRHNQSVQMQRVGLFLRLGHGDDMHCHSAAGIDNSRPQPAEATRTVTWHPLEQFFALAGQEAGNMLEPFVQPLAEWLEK